jgi:hypothetical protein
VGLMCMHSCAAVEPAVHFCLCLALARLLQSPAQMLEDSMWRTIWTCWKEAGNAGALQVNQHCSARAEQVSGASCGTTEHSQLQCGRGVQLLSRRFATMRVRVRRLQARTTFGLCLSRQTCVCQDAVTQKRCTTSAIVTGSAQLPQQAPSSTFTLTTQGHALQSCRIS